MSIITYKEHNLSPEVSVNLSEINQYSLRAKALLTAVGDYWTNYYRNLDPIAVATTGSVASVSKEYTRLLDMIKASNILDVPFQQSEQFDLLVINHDDVETVYESDGSTVAYYFVPLKDVIDTAFLTTSLFESRVVLERGKHYDVVLRKGYRFYVDLFGDNNITNYAYTVGEASAKQILLWACDIAFKSSIIYERYGRFLYKSSIDSEKYKWVVSALMRFYENAKTVQGIQDVLNIMYGIPYTRYRNEVVEEIYYVDEHLQRINANTEDPYICIKTDKAEYFTYCFSDVKYSVGDVVPQFSLLADFNKVEDYITNPGWWENCAFPSSLADGAEDLSPAQRNELMDKVLKYNTVHINIGISFETYATYLNQVKELFNIIESGFPVYLFPLVDTFFKAVFIDKEDMTDEFEILKFKVSLVSKYDWGQFLNFDGTASYYMDPDRDYGSNAHQQLIRFDGSDGYYLPDRHDSRIVDVEHHDGENGDYTTGWRYSHNNDREELRITKVTTRYSDEYPWRMITEVRPLCYDNHIEATGDHIFGENLEERFNEIFKIRLIQKTTTETFGQVNDNLRMRCTTGICHNTSDASYNGEILYDNVTLMESRIRKENFQVVLNHQEP